MESNKGRLVYSVSVISTTPRNFFDSLPLLEKNGIDRIHVDAMDGRFVPRLGLYPEFVQEIRASTSLPVDVHMMLEEPEKYIPDFADAGATRLVPHIESMRHAHRVVSQIVDRGLEAGLAINPHSDFSAIRYLVDDLASVTIMAINPGIVGHKAIPVAFQKIADLKSVLANQTKNIAVEVDGGVTFSNISEFQKAGADALVVGAGTIFHPQGSLSDNMATLETLRAHR